MSASLSRILVLLDGTDTDQQVLPLAVRIAGVQRGTVELTLLRVIAPPPAATLPPGPDTLPAVDLAEREARRELRALSPAPRDLCVRRAVLVGDRAAEIALWLSDHPVDLAVYAPKPGNRLTRLFAPDRVEAALRRAGVPLLVAALTSPSCPSPAREGRSWVARIGAA